MARLYTDSAFQARLSQQFDGNYKLNLHLAPPLLARRDPRTGHPRKRAFGPWIWPCLRLLAGFRNLRGTAFDPFGRTAERRAERQLITDYELLIEDIIAGLTPGNHAVALELTGLPSRIRGFGHVKAEAIAAAAERRAALLAAFNRPASTSRAAQ